MMLWWNRIKKLERKHFNETLKLKLENNHLRQELLYTQQLIGELKERLGPEEVKKMNDKKISELQRLACLEPRLQDSGCVGQALHGNQLWGPLTKGGRV